LQEVHGRTLTESHDQAQLLGEKLGMPWLYAPSERQWWHDAFGNGLITSLPVASWQRFPLSGTAATNNRSLLLVHMPLGGRMVHVLITHLPTTNDRESELRAVSALFFSLAEPALLIGDLNTRPGNPQDPPRRLDPRPRSQMHRPRKLRPRRFGSPVLLG
jgi:endonuclease/exonuclease/phosphatase family metal-dependent hydrolase